MIRRRTLPVLALFLVPWTVQVRPDGLFFVFPWGLASSRSLGVVTLWTYLFEATPGVAGLPRRLLAWPLSTVVYACATGALGLVRFGVDGYRVAAVLLAFAGLAHLQVALGLIRLGSVAVPVGPVLLLAAAWWTSTRELPAGSRGRGEAADGDCSDEP